MRAMDGNIALVYTDNDNYYKIVHGQNNPTRYPLHLSHLSLT